MPESVNSSPSSSDEIDLFALFETFWRGKWIIAAFCVVAASVALVYHTKYNRSITASLSIRQLSAIEMSDFESLSSLGIVGGLESENLLELYYDYISSFSNAKYLIEHFGLIEDSLEGEDLRQQIVKTAEARIKTNLRLPRNNETFKAHIRLELVHDNRDQLLSMVETMLNRTAEQQRDALLGDFDAAIKNLEEKRDYEIQQIKIEIEGAKHKYFQEKADAIEVLESRISTLRAIYSKQKIDKIAILTEQADIARSLNIEFPIEIDMEKIPGSSIFSLVSTQSQPLYFRGFKALEREVDIIQNRASDDSHIPGLRQLESELFELTNRTNDEAYISGFRELQHKLFLLEHDPGIMRSKNEVSRLVEHNPRLRFTSADLERVTFKGVSVVKILFAATILGFGMGCMWVLILAAVRYRRASKNDSLS